MFHEIWGDLSKNSILQYEIAHTLFNQLSLCSKICGGNTAEVGVYEGMTSKMIINICKKPHYCYDTFEGIAGSNTFYGDKHGNGEFVCHLDKVKLNLYQAPHHHNKVNIIYKKGFFPETFEEHDCSFCLVYSDTATYLGAKTTFEYFAPTIILGGKIIYYVDNNCVGVINATNEIIQQNITNNSTFRVSHTDNFIIFTKN